MTASAAPPGGPSARPASSRRVAPRLRLPRLRLRSVRQQVTAAVVVTAVLAIVVVSWFNHAQQQRAAAQRSLDGVETLADTQRERIAAHFESTRALLAVIANQAGVRDALDDFAASADGDARARAHAKLRMALEDAAATAQDLLVLRVLDADGVVVASTQGDEDTDLSGHPAFAPGRREVTVGHLQQDGDRTVEVAAGPVNAAESGVLMVERSTAALEAIVHDPTGLGSTGETVIGAAQPDGSAMVVVPTRLDPDAAHQVSVATGGHVPLISAVVGQELAFENGVDYRGVAVMAASRYLDETGLGIVVKIDRAEALPGSPFVDLNLVLAGAIVLALATALGLVLGRDISRPIDEVILAMRAATEGELSRRVDVDGSGEAQRLGGSFNELTDRLQTTITEIHRTVDARTSELNAFFATAAAGLIKLDFDGTILDVNPAIVAMLGRAREDLIGTRLDDYIDMRASPGVTTSTLLMAPGSVIVDVVFRLDDDHMVPTRVSTAASSGPDGDATIALQVVDISDQVRARSDYQSLFENAATPTAVSGLDRKITKVNRALLTLLGLDADAVHGRMLADFLHPDDLPSDEDLALSYGQDHKVDIEARIATGDGWRWCRLTGVVMRDTNDLPTGIITQVMDVHDRRMAEDERDELIRTLSRANGNLERFARSTAHDLRNPIGAMAGFARVLRSDDSLPDAQRDHLLSRIEANATRSIELIEALLANARRMQGRQAATQVALGESVEQAVEVLADELDATGGVVEARDLPTVEAHRVLLDQIFTNLIANSLKYRHPDRRPRIVVSAHEAADGFIVTVADNGTGIPHDQRPLVFAEGYRMSNHTHVSGTGLGLATCQGAVRQHGGEIWIDDSPLGGVAFVFEIPKRLERHDAVQRPAADSAARLRAEVERGVQRLDRVLDA